MWLDDGPMLPKGGGRTKHITLIDPDKQSPEVAAQRALVAVECGTSAIFVGGSTDTGSNIVPATSKNIAPTKNIYVLTII